MSTQFQRVHALGDSLVYGTGDSDRYYMGWTGRLRNAFHEQNGLLPKHALLPGFYTYAQIGETIGRLAKRFYQGQLISKPNVLNILSIGLNDSAIDMEDGRVVTTEQAFVDTLKSVLDTLIDEENSQTLYVGFPCFNETRTQPFGMTTYRYINERAGAFEALALQCFKAYGLPAVGLFEESSMTARFVDEMVCEDGLHPNSAGYDWAFRHMLPVVEQLWSSRVLQATA
jgi:lysophospholipase L1-like esterase